MATLATLALTTKLRLGADDQMVEARMRGIRCRVTPVVRYWSDNPIRTIGISLGGELLQASPSM